MLQALRFCLMGAGGKMSAGNRKQLTPTLTDMMGCTDDSTRMVASGCVGVLCLSLTDDELTDILSQQLLDTSSSVDWTLRHGRGTALSIAIKEAPDKIWTGRSDNVRKTVISLTEADRIPLCTSGYRCLGYLLSYLIKQNEIEKDLISSLMKGLKHDSNDIKQMIGQIVSYIMSKTTEPLDPAVCKMMVSPLVMGTKEKNTVVRTNSEHALVSLLQLRKSDSYYKTVIAMLDSGMQDSVQEVMTKSLRKIASQPESPTDQMDDTILV
ncbi:stalled ribosome sensor GCN1-like [Ruditapes philippinarum]|uniref:stalled ribosome sensor GCN1-like n=1 Tax=Ruditapes philippinarum TaxID=129788 RepID=UPI00295A589F|nr:stalled ribosome sensor GCN1-like [Ruditapes philippinarum]